MSLRNNINNDDLFQFIRTHRQALQQWLFISSCCLMGKSGDEREKIIAKLADSCATKLCRVYHRDALQPALCDAIKSGLQNQDIAIETIIKDYAKQLALLRSIPIDAVVALIMLGMKNLETQNYDATKLSKTDISTIREITMLELDEEELKLSVVLHDTRSAADAILSYSLRAFINSRIETKSLYDWSLQAKVQQKKELAIEGVQLDKKLNISLIRSNFMNKYFLSMIAFCVFISIFSSQLGVIADSLPDGLVFMLGAAGTIGMILAYVKQFSYAVNLSKHEAQKTYDAYADGLLSHLRTVKQELIETLHKHLEMKFVEYNDDKNQSFSLSILNTSKHDEELTHIVKGTQLLRKRIKRVRILGEIFDTEVTGTTKKINSFIDDCWKDDNKYYRTVTSGEIVTRMELDRSIKSTNYHHWKLLKEVFKTGRVGGETGKCIKFFKSAAGKAEVKDSNISSRLYADTESRENGTVFHFKRMGPALH